MIENTQVDLESFFGLLCNELGLSLASFFADVEAEDLEDFGDGGIEDPADNADVSAIFLAGDLAGDSCL